MEPTGEQQQVREIDHFSQAGKQTQITPEISGIAANIRGNTISKVQAILDFTHTLQVRNFDHNVFRKRTAVDIIKDGYVTGCTDSALTFIAIARASGLPTKYVETIDREWLDRGGNPIGGHIYARVYDNDGRKWIWIDPMDKKVDITPPQDRVVFKEGLDSWDVGITDFGTLQKNFQTFRQAWCDKQK